MNEGYKTIVESLCNTYLGDIQPKISALNGVVQLK